MAAPLRAEPQPPTGDQTRYIRRGEAFAEPYNSHTRHQRPITRKVETTTPEIKQTGSAPTVDEQFSQQYKQAGQHRNQTAANDTTRDAQVVYAAAPAATKPVRQPVHSRRFKLRKKVTGSAALARGRATMVNLNILAWSLGLWIIFQLPTAIFSLSFFMAAGMIDTIGSWINPTYDGKTENTTWAQDMIGETFNFVGNILKDTNTLLTELIGLDVGALLDPMNWYLGFYALLVGYGLLLLLSMYAQYKLAFLNPLSGAAAGLKVGFFCLAFVGYLIPTPITALLPWFLPWLFVVWFFPK
jgi:hypothetical protein